MQGNKSCIFSIERSKGTLLDLEQELDNESYVHDELVIRGISHGL
jgi:hypothetical protein